MSGRRVLYWVKLLVALIACVAGATLGLAVMSYGILGGGGVMPTLIGVACTVASAVAASIVWEELR